MSSLWQIPKKPGSNSYSPPAQKAATWQRPFSDPIYDAVSPKQEGTITPRAGFNLMQMRIFPDSPAPVQAKLTVGAPGDKYEPVADIMASQVMKMSAPENEEPVEGEQKEVQTKPLAEGISPIAQREIAPEESPLQNKTIQQDELTENKPEEEDLVAQKSPAPESIQRDEATAEEKPQEDLLAQKSPAPESIQRDEAIEDKPKEEDLTVQQKAAPEGKSSDSGNLESQLNGSKGGGSPLADEVRAFMEPRFGADFSGVRVHTDSNAVQMNKDLGAQAFAHGSDIYYGAGKSPGKDELTAHELTHTIQQGAAGKLNKDVSLKRESPSQEKQQLQPKKLPDDIDKTIQNKQLENLPVKLSIQRGVDRSQSEENSNLESQGQLPKNNNVTAKELKSQKEPDKNLLQIILGGLMGEFNPDPSLPEIGADFISSIIPVLDQIADGRDLVAHLYFMLFRGEFNSPGRWVGLGFTLIGFIPEIGSVIKSISKLLTKGTKEALQHIDEILAVISRLLPGVSINSLQGLIASHWDEGVSLGKKHWIDFINQLKNRIGWLPEIGSLGEQKRLALQQLDRVLAATDSKLSQAFAEMRRIIDEVFEALGRRLDPNGNLATANGAPIPRRTNSPQPQRPEPARIEGRGESNPSPRNNRFINVEEAREFIAQKIASGERITVDLFGGQISQIPGAINFDLVAEEGIRGSIADLTKIFPTNSVDEIIATGPQAEFLEEAARILKPRGRIYINANYSNRFRFGTSRGKKSPDAETLERLGLRLVQDDGTLDARFADLEFRRTDGGEIRRDTVRTVIFEKVE